MEEILSQQARAICLLCTLLEPGTSYRTQDKLIQVLDLLGAADQPHMWSRGSEHALEGINGVSNWRGT